MKKTIRKKIKNGIYVAVAISVVAACIVSLAEGRFTEKKSGKLVEVSALYEESSIEPHYKRVAYQTIADLKGDSSKTGNISTGKATAGDASSDTNAGLTEQEIRDKAALMALVSANTKSQSVAAQAKERQKKYKLNVIPKVTEDTTSHSSILDTLNSTAGAVTADSSQGTYLGRFILTGYCPCIICCGKTNGITASGTHATANHTVAADSRLAFGTKLIVNGIVYTVEDRGGAIKGNHLDIFFNTHAEATAFGKQEADVYLYTDGSVVTETTGADSTGIDGSDTAD